MFTFYYLHISPCFNISSYELSHIQVIQMNIEESYRKLIAQELKINQSAQCPYVVVCYQSFYNNGVISIILEYMDGGSLLDFLKKVRTIPEPYLAAICKQVGNLNIIYLYEILSIANINSNMLFSCSSFLFIDARCWRVCCIFIMKNTLSTGI